MLSGGSRLGPYEILSPLGAGGMGEVYKARDTRLDRTVAIKVLPETLTADPQFRDRFDREAKAIAALTISVQTTISGATRDVAITPDGTRVVYTGANGTALFVRALGQLDARPLNGLGAPSGPFVSPDGQWIGFADGLTTLKKVAMTGGPAVTLARLDGNFRGATWSSDGTIVSATNSGAIGLQRIAAGGEPLTVLTRPDRVRGEADHLWPEFLPGSQAVLFTITSTTGALEQAQLAVLDLRTGTQTTLIQGGSDAHYVPNGAPRAAAVPGTPSGYLVYGAAGTLRAVAFDLARLAVVGTPVPVVPQVVTTTAGAVDVAVANDATLVYVPGAVVAAGVQNTLVWVDRHGQETPISAPPRGYGHVRISPDGTGAALANNDQEQDVWVWDLVRGGLSRLTFDPGQDFYPVWTPDSRRLIFSSARAGARNLFAQAADGTGAVTRLTESPTGENATSISPDGTRLVFQTSGDVMQLRLDGTHQVTPLVQTPFTERNGEVSPDGRWLAYEANDSGSFEIYVRPFPDVAKGRWPVSTGGGTQPVWARSGQELFYLAPSGALMRVGVARGTTWAATVPTKLLEGRYYAGTATQSGRMYDVATDGRFLMIKPAGGSESTPPPSSLIVVQHFDEELKRLVPSK